MAERGLLPDTLVRWGIRRLLEQRLAQLDRAGRAGDESFRELMRSSPIALHTEAANAQHYELPAEFFCTVLGRNLKYSSALWEPGTTSLTRAENSMLELTAERAELKDGQRVLELGCGWGSLSLWMARHLPNSEILAVSNSKTQRGFIEARARTEGLDNLEVRTADMNAFDPGARFDRIVSVEMFEHMRNWERLLTRASSWIEPGGALFVHVFAHHAHCYPFEPRSDDDWMARHFFTGGMMPSHGIFDALDSPWSTEQSWVVDGTHYARTAEAWLQNLDDNREALTPVFEATYGARDARRWLERWRMFFMACAELFGYRQGREWHVSHHRLRKPERAGARG